MRQEHEAHGNETTIRRESVAQTFHQEGLGAFCTLVRGCGTRKLIGEIAPMSQEEAEKWYKELCADENRAWYTIVVKENNRVVGEAGLLRMFKPWRNTDMTIIISEKDARGKGYGKKAGHLLLTYAFHTLGFHRISVGIVAFNKPAIKYWKSLGFKKEGIHREEYYCDNKYSDFIMMSILENEYKQPTKK